MGDQGPTFQARAVRLLDSDPGHGEVRLEVEVDGPKFLIFRMTYDQVRRLCGAYLAELET